MRMTDFTIYNEALANTSASELDELSKAGTHDDQFLKFLRYVQMLDVSDPKQQEG